MHLLQARQAAQYQKVDEPVVETVTKPETVQPEEPKKTNAGPLLFLIVVVVGGCGIYLYIKTKEKKEKDRKAKEDPDADYEDEDYLEDLPEEVEEYLEEEGQDTSLNENLDEE